jgi:hypothetical protein
LPGLGQVTRDAGDDVVVVCVEPRWTAENAFVFRRRPGDTVSLLDEVPNGHVGDVDFGGRCAGKQRLGRGGFDGRDLEGGKRVACVDDLRGRGDGEAEACGSDQQETRAVLLRGHAARYAAVSRRVPCIPILIKPCGCREDGHPDFVMG